MTTAVRTEDTRASLEAKGYRYDNTKPCRGVTCTDDIEWWITPSGAKAPFNVMTGPDSPAVSHFATCSDSKSFRRK